MKVLLHDLEKHKGDVRYALLGEIAEGLRDHPAPDNFAIEVYVYPKQRAPALPDADNPELVLVDHDMLLSNYDSFLAECLGDDDGIITSLVRLEITDGTQLILKHRYNDRGYGDNGSGEHLAELADQHGMDEVLRRFHGLVDTYTGWARPTTTAVKSPG